MFTERLEQFVRKKQVYKLEIGPGEREWRETNEQTVEFLGEMFSIGNYRQPEGYLCKRILLPS